MKRLPPIFISDFQVKIVIMIWCLILAAGGTTVIYSIVEMKHALFLRERWHAETLANQFLYTMAPHIISSEGSIGDEEGLRRISTELQRLLEKQKTESDRRLAVIDTTAYWVAHQEQLLKNTRIRNQQLLQHLERQQSGIISDGKIYHTIFPFWDHKNRFLGMIDVTIPKQHLHRQLWQYSAKTIGVFLGMTVLVCALFLFFTRPLFSSFQTIIHTTERISAGNLSTTQIAVHGHDDIRRLTLAFHEMAVNFRTAITQMQHVGTLIASALQEMLTAIDRLAVSYEEQSASVAQTSMNMESVVTASQQISKSTDTVVQIAEKTRTDAQHGLHVAEETITKMHDIQQSNQTNTQHIKTLGLKSKEITKIMDVIVSIADQTKLIAFNASLEAAGAGKAGRRFEIVAKEIRTLANHVIGSTVTIRQTIADIQTSIQNLISSSETSTENIHQGASYTVRTTEWLKEILSGTTQTTRIAQRISRSVLKQQLASEEISVALKHLLTNTDEFAKTAQHIQEIADHLDGLIKELESVITIFHV